MRANTLPSERLLFERRTTPQLPGRVLVAAAVVSLIASAQVSSLTIVGRWYTVERSRGGIGAILEFRADGSVDFSPGAIVECTYVFSRQKVTLKFMDPDNRPQPDQVLVLPRLSLNKMTVQAANSKNPTPAQEWTRVGEPEDRSRLLLGNWSARNQDGQTMNWKFRADGSAVLTVTFSTMVGQYRLTKDFVRLRLDVDGAPLIEGAISWEGDVLVLWGERSPLKLHRF